MDQIPFEKIRPAPRCCCNCCLVKTAAISIGITQIIIAILAIFYTSLFAVVDNDGLGPILAMNWARLMVAGYSITSIVTITVKIQK